MKKVFIKYNPYKLETKITVDGKELKENSQIREYSLNTRIQEWIEELPTLLYEECNDTAFDITFYGTLPDYDDLEAVISQYRLEKDTPSLVFQLHHKQAKEIADKEASIERLFQEIQKGSFADLKKGPIKNAFEQFKKNEFNICVVATMSAGKSTLINAMLGEKLMPSKAEACTAKITYLKDNDNKNGVWKADVYGKNGEKIITYDKATLKTMQELNSNEDVSVVKAEGNIPFVSAKDISLVLIDTPGPNNTRDGRHKEIQNNFLVQSSKALVLYVMTGTYGNNDDNSLLQTIAESMSVRGKQSKDRFLFVVNQVDGRKKEDGELKDTLDSVRDYLAEKGIVNPHLFPTGALPALNIRLVQNNLADEEAMDEAEFAVKKLNERTYLQCDPFSTLPASVAETISQQLDMAKGNDDAYEEALIHTGIPSLEAAIRQYVEKYAKTAMIKNIYDTFTRQVEETKAFEKIKKELSESEEKRKKIQSDIQEIKRKVNDIKKAQQFEKDMDEAIDRINKQSKELIDEIQYKYQQQLSKQLLQMRGRSLTLPEAIELGQQLKVKSEKLDHQFQDDLSKLLQKQLIEAASKVLERYKEKIASFAADMSNPNTIVIDPIQLVGSTIPKVDEDFIQKLKKTRRVADGQEWIPNTDKAWYKPWTWFQEEGYYRTLFKDVQFVSDRELAQDLLKPIQRNLRENIANAHSHALVQSGKVKEYFMKEFEKMKKVLKSKLDELDEAANKENHTKEEIDKIKKNLDWLERIQNKFNEIVEI